MRAVDAPVIAVQKALEVIVGEGNVLVTGTGDVDAPWRIEFPIPTSPGTASRKTGSQITVWA